MASCDVEATPHEGLPYPTGEASFSCCSEDQRAAPGVSARASSTSEAAGDWRASDMRG